MGISMAGVVGLVNHIEITQGEQPMSKVLNYTESNHDRMLNLITSNLKN